MKKSCSALSSWCKFVPGIFLITLVSGSAGFLVSQQNLASQLKGDVNPELCDYFEYSYGEGEESNPYLVSTLEGLQAIKCNLEASYKLSNNIDASTTSSWNYDSEVEIYKGFEPIGSNREGFDTAFVGSFDGNGYTISGLIINRPSSSHVGLFGYIYDSENIEDIDLEGGNIIGENYVGAIAGQLEGGSITNSYSNLPVVGTNYVGGLVGYLEGGEVEQSASEGNVTGQAEEVPNCEAISDEGTCNQTEGCSYVVQSCTHSEEPNEKGLYIGGLVGQLSDYGSVDESYATGDVSGIQYVGGLIGSMSGEEMSISNNYATGNVTANRGEAGGLVGALDYGLEVSTSYATGNVATNNGPAGGLVGYVEENNGIIFSFATGTVSAEGQGSLGGLVGNEEDENSYEEAYFTDSDNDNDLGTLEEGGPQALQSSNHDIYEEWSFGETWIWDSEEDYPIHEWDTEPVTVIWVDDNYSEPCEEEGECESDPGSKTCDSDGYTWGQNCFDSIDNALEKIAENGTIHVAAGSYDGFRVEKEGVSVIGTTGATINDDSYYYNSIDAGVFVTAASVKIQNLIVDASAGGFDVGIYLYNDKDGDIQGITLDGNTIHLPESYSCECRSSMAGIMADGNEGMPISITNNIISYTPEGSEGNALCSEQTHPQACTFIEGGGCEWNSEEGICEAEESSSTSALHGIALFGNNDPVYSITGNTVNGANTGLYISEEDLTGAIIQLNQFSNNEVGIGVYAGGNRVTIKNNNLINNDEYGIMNDDEENPLDATRNWWGHASGPYHAEGNAQGQGNAVSGDVLFNPFYTSVDRKALSDGSSAGASFGSETEGRAELPPALTEILLNSSTKLDLAEQVEVVDEGEITLGGQTRQWNNFPIKSIDGGSTTNANFEEGLTIGDQTVELVAGITLESGTDGEDIVITNEEYENVEVSIPDGTSILAPEACDYLIQAPSEGNSSGTAPSGFSFGSTVIEVGSSDCVLVFDHPTMIEINGLFSSMAYRPTGSDNWTNIEGCDGSYETPTSPEFPGECFISNGSDKTKVYTYHFTGFSQTVAGFSGGSGGGPSIMKPNEINHAYYLPSRGTERGVHLADEPVSLQQSNGQFTQPVVLEDIYEHTKVSIPIDTVAKDLNEEGYLGTILPPKKAVASSIEVPEGMKFLSAFNLQTVDNQVLIFDKKFEVEFPMKKHAAAQNPKIFSYNPDTKDLKLLGKGGKVTHQEKPEKVHVITGKSNYLGHFVLLDTQSTDLSAYNSEISFKASAPKTEPGEIQIPLPIDQPIPPFADTVDHPAKKYIDQLLTRGVITGKTKDSFAPEDGITLAQLQEITQKAFGIDLPQEAYLKIVSKVLAEKNRNLSRVEALKIILETSNLDLSAPGKRFSFTDVPIGSWFEKYITYAQGKGLIFGNGSTFNPNAPITRADTAKVIAKIWDLMKTDKSYQKKRPSPAPQPRIDQQIPKFTDLEGHPALSYINALLERGIFTGAKGSVYAPEEGLNLGSLLEITQKAFTKGVNYPSYNQVLAKVASSNRNVSRTEALLILLESSGIDLTIPEKRISYQDVGVGTWYEKYVALAQTKGLMHGSFSTLYAPDQAITKAEIAKIVAKIWEIQAQ